MTPLSEEKLLTNNFDEGTNELEDMPLMEKKYSTKDVEKSTDKLSDMKHSVVTISRKGLDRFRGPSKGFKGWFKLDSGFFKQYFLQFIQNSIRKYFKEY